MHKMRMMLWALSAVVMVACVREDEPAGPDPDPNGDGLIQADDAYDLFFQFQYDSDTASTRAGSDGLVDGERREHAIGVNGNFVLFFNQENKFIFLAPLTRYIHEHENEGGAEPENIEAIYKSRFFTKRRDLTLSCLVLLNAMPLYPQLETLLNSKAPLSEVLEMEWPSTSDPFDPLTIGRDGVFFTMSNAVYLNEKKELQTAVKISKENLVEVEDDSELLKDPDPAKVIHVPVERMVARFSFGFDASVNDDRYDDAGKQEDGSFIIYPPELNEDESYSERVLYDLDLFTGFDKNGIPETTSVKWRVRITGWNINALETQAKVFKSLPSDDGKWNDPQNFRSYWARDLHYDFHPSLYPWQYRRAIDKRNYPDMTHSSDNSVKDFYSYDVQRKAEKLMLKNYSFENLNVKNLSETRYIYVPENTYDYMHTQDEYKRYLDGREHLLAGSHLIVCAELEIYDTDTGEYKTFKGYRDRAGRYYKEENKVDCFIRMMRTFNYYLNSQSEMRYVYYNWAPSTMAAVTYDPEYKEEYEETKCFFAKPTNNAHSMDETSEVTHQYEIYLELTPRDTSTAVRLFNDANEINVADFIEKDPYGEINSYDDVINRLKNCMTGAEVKDGDGKVLPWIDGLRILDVKAKRKEASIPVYEISNDSIAKMVSDYADKLEFEGKTLKEAEVLRALEREKYESWLLSGGEDYSEEYEGKPLPRHHVSVNDRRSLLYDWLGAIDHFADGKMYYAAEVKNQLNGDIRYGTLRNHWYQYTLKAIKHVGSPVDNVGQEIVPLMVGPNDQIHLKVGILGWHQVNQDVTLPQ